MKVAEIKKYSKFEKILTENKKINELGENEILILVKFAGLNHVDKMIKEGELKIVFNYSFPLVLGNEISGVVEKVGKNVKKFKVGDKVYSRLPINQLGGFGEKIVVNEKEVGIFPNYLTYEEAATIPLVGLTAIQAFEKLKIEKGKTIFISGATGSFGNIAVPLAKYKGLKVIVSGNVKNKEKMLNIGVEKFIDYKSENYVEILKNEKVDYVIDTIGNNELVKQFSILKNGGSLVSIKGIPNKKFAEEHNLSYFKKIIFQLISNKIEKLSKKNNQKYHFLFVKSNGNQLDEITNILNEIKLRPSIDRIFEFEKINEAFEYLERNSVKGKIIIKIDK